MRLLIVDDDDNNREILRRMTSMLGHSVGTAVDGASAIAEAKRALESGQPYERVLCDMRMPDKSGAETADALRALPGFDAPIYALTGDDRSDVDMSRFQGYLQKPFTIDDLKTALA